MLGLEMNVGLDAGPIQKMCGADSVPGPDFVENLTSLALWILEPRLITTIYIILRSLKTKSPLHFRLEPQIGCVVSHKTSLDSDIHLHKTILIPKMWKKMRNLQKKN